MKFVSLVFLLGLLANAKCQEIPIGGFLEKYDPFLILPDFKFYLDRIFPSDFLKNGFLELYDMSFKGFSSLVMKLGESGDEDMLVTLTGEKILFEIKRYELDLEGIGLRGNITAGFHDQFEIGMKAVEKNGRITVSEVHFDIELFKLKMSGVPMIGPINVEQVLNGLIKDFYNNNIKAQEPKIMEVIWNLILYFANNIGT